MNMIAGSSPRFVLLLALLVGNMLLAMLFAACGSEPERVGGVEPNAELPASVATAVADAESDVAAALARSGAIYCGRLCQPDFWLNADPEALDNELARGSNVNARGRRGFTPIHYAASLASLPTVAALLDRDVDINALSDKWGLTPLQVAATGGAAMLSRDHNRAVHRQEPAVIALLLEHGADAKSQDGGTTPLHGVTDPVVAALLLSYGADIEAIDIDGRTPLHYAAQSGNSDVAAFLLANGAHVDSQDVHGTTPLHEAVSSGANLSLIRVLLKFGADANIRAGQIGVTVLHLAISEPVDPQAIALLVENGADVDARNNFGETACQYAMEREQSETIMDLVCP